MSLLDLQRSFMNYLLHDDHGIKQQVKEQGPVDTATRLHIYANAYRVRLREAIETDHPALGTYLGDEWFEQMVAGFIDAHPSAARSLRYFAESLPEYLRHTEPFQTQPIIAEIAAFERALMHGFDAAEGHRLKLDELRAVPPEQWPVMTFQFHPSVSLFQADWNSVESWQAIKADKAPPEAAPQTNRQWLIWRNGERLTEFVSLDPAPSQTLAAAMQGSCFADLCEGLLAHMSPEAVSEVAVTHLQEWIAYGWLSAIHAGD